MDKKEVGIWLVILIIAAVAVVVIYTGVTAGPGKIDVSLKLSSSNTSYIYPYQSAFRPVVITNYGSKEFRDLGVGIFINGNLSEAYNVTMPQYNSTAINFSKEFTTPGTYNVTFVVDPSRLYDIENRSLTKASFTVVVQQPEAPDPASYLPANQLAESDSYMGSAGYLTASYLEDNYSVDLQLSSIPIVNAFFSPLLNLTYSYIQGIYSADAVYSNSSAYSLWIQGSLGGNITAVWATGLKDSNVTVSYVNASVGRVSLITLDKNTTICSWYSDGWLKSLALEGNVSCSAALSGSGRSLVGNYVLPAVNDSSILANFSSYSYLGYGYGRLMSVGNSSILYESVGPNPSPDYTCYGEITTIDNISYCSTYIFSSTGKIGALSVVSTKSFIGQRNLTVMALANTSVIPDEVSTSISILQGLNVSGISGQFVSGINSTCELNVSLSCYSPRLTLGNLTLGFYNKLNQSVHIASMSCYQAGTPKYYTLNVTIPGLTYENVTLPCYNDGAVITGIPLDITLNLGMHYSITGITGNFTAAGSAYIV